MSYCMKCGAKIQEGSGFCPNCGTPAPVRREASSAANANAAPRLVVSAENGRNRVPRPNARIRRRKRKARIVASFIISLILSILLASIVVLSASLAITRKIAEPESIERIVDGTDLSTLRVGTLVGEAADLTLPAWMHKGLGSMITAGMGLTEDGLGRLLEKSTLKRFVSAKVNAYIDAIKDGSGEGEVTKEELIELFRENESLVSETLGFSPSELEYAFLSLVVDRAPLEKISLENLLTPSQLVVARNVLDISMLFGVIALGAIFMALIFCANGAKLSPTALWVGFCALLPGILLLLTGVYGQPGRLDFFSEYADLTKALAQEIADHCLFYGKILAGSGGALIVLEMILRAVSNRRA